MDVDDRLLDVADILGSLCICDVPTVGQPS